MKDIIVQAVKTDKTRKNVRLMIPIMVHWAKTGQKHHTYGELIHAIGKETFSGIGHALYSVQCVIDQLNDTIEDINKKVPTLNSLCKNAKNMLPSEGFEYVESNYNELSPEGKELFVDGLDNRAIEYPYWDWVLKTLGLKAYIVLSDEDIDSFKHPYEGMGGEGTEHKALKDYIFSHPEVLGYKDVIDSQKEYVLPSGDKIDVFFELEDDTHIGIEVKSSISPDEDVARGVFQCVKYYAVMDALRTLESKNYEIEVLLVTQNSLSHKNKVLCNELNIDYIEQFNF